MTSSRGGRRTAVALLAVLLLAGASFTMSSAPAGAQAAGPPTEFTLRPGMQVTQHYDTLLLGDPAGVTTAPPEACGGTPATCFAIKLKLRRDRQPGALNFMRATLAWDAGPELPTLGLVLTALLLTHVNDADFYVWDKPDHYLGQDYAGTGVPQVGSIANPIVAGLPIIGPEIVIPGDPNDPPPGGATLAVPEVAGWTVKQDEYNLVVAGSTGVINGFTLTLTFSNELFQRPLDLSAEGSLDGSLAPIDFSGDPPSAVAIAPDVGAALPSLAPVGVDNDFTGFGAGLGASVGAAPDVNLANVTRRTAAAGAAPSGAALLLWLGVVPIALVGAVAVALGRRRHATRLR